MNSIKICEISQKLKVANNPGLVELVFALREIVPDSLTSPKSDPGVVEEEVEETKSSPLVKRSKSGSERSGLTKRRKLRVKQRG